MDPEQTTTTANEELATEATPETTTETAQAAAPQAGWLDNAKALVSQRAGLLSDNRKLRAELNAARAEASALRQDLADLVAQHELLTQDFELQAGQIEELETALKAAEAQQTTVEKAVMHELAALGVPVTDLPAADNDGKTDAEAAWDAFCAATDPQEKAILARKYKEVAAKG